MTRENGRIWRRRIFWFVNSAFTSYSRQGCRTMSRIIMLRYWRWRPKECASLCVRQSCLWPPPIWPCCCQSGDGPRSQVEALPSDSPTPRSCQGLARHWLKNHVVPVFLGSEQCAVNCHCCNPSVNRVAVVLCVCTWRYHWEIWLCQWFMSEPPKAFVLSVYMINSNIPISENEYLFKQRNRFSITEKFH